MTGVQTCALPILGTYVKLSSPTSQLITSDIGISGNLTITGEVTYANTRQLQVGDNIITLNADLPLTATPIDNAGVEVNRANKNSNAALLWIETAGQWSISGNIAQTVTTYIASNTLVEQYAASSNAYANTVGTAGNNYASILSANNAAGANAWANTVGTAGNNASILRDTAGNNFTITSIAAGNNWTNTVVAAANTWANTKLSNTSGITFAGSLTFTGNVNAANVIVTGQTTFISANSVTIGQSEINSISYITSTTGDQTIDTFLNTSYRFEIGRAHV